MPDDQQPRLPTVPDIPHDVAALLRQVAQVLKGSRKVVVLPPGRRKGH
jgi:hypothetical protein